MNFPIKPPGFHRNENAHARQILTRRRIGIKKMNPNWQRDLVCVVVVHHGGYITCCAGSVILVLFKIKTLHLIFSSWTSQIHFCRADPVLLFTNFGYVTCCANSVIPAFKKSTYCIHFSLLEQPKSTPAGWILCCCSPALVTSLVAPAGLEACSPLALALAASSAGH